MKLCSLCAADDLGADGAAAIPMHPVHNRSIQVQVDAEDAHSGGPRQSQASLLPLLQLFKHFPGSRRFPHQRAPHEDRPVRVRERWMRL